MTIYITLTLIEERAGEKKACGIVLTVHLMKEKAVIVIATFMSI